MDVPMCSSPSLTALGHLYCTLAPTSLLSRPGYADYVYQQLRARAHHSVKGQYIIDPVLQLVKHKLRHRDHPLILHFAGDNGVGKTSLAEVISLAMALRCKSAEDCHIGDSTLELSGAAYDALTVAEFRRFVVGAVTSHLQRHPRNAVIIINELTSLHPEKVMVLLPLLGRGSYFPEHPQVSLRGAIVIITTDLGREGRTRGKNLAQMRALIESDFQDLYSKLSTSYLHTFPFLPITLDAATDIVRMGVADSRCAWSMNVTISDDAVAWMLEGAKPYLASENGRAVIKEVLAAVEPLLEQGDKVRPYIIDVDAHGHLALFSEEYTV
ncbi:hypothetical protein STCU_07636 [Strigomonas culicis]|nr:hypothetical protein STCU_07636 [Strigomonas culicis]|eukprot:EPY23593.1 hypothetical protein STCU_07636 [Strigomonas culicis]